jgi:hypothetical protein
MFVCILDIWLYKIGLSRTSPSYFNFEVNRCYFSNNLTFYHFINPIPWLLCWYLQMFELWDFPEKGALVLKHVGISCHVRFEPFYMHWFFAVIICKNNTRWIYCQTLSLCSSLNVRNQDTNPYKMKFMIWDGEFRYEYFLITDLIYRVVFAAITILNNNRKSALQYVATTSKAGLHGSFTVIKYSLHLTQTRTEEEANERPNTQSIFLLVIILLFLQKEETHGLKWRHNLISTQYNIWVCKHSLGMQTSTVIFHPLLYSR